MKITRIIFPEKKKKRNPFSRSPCLVEGETEENSLPPDPSNIFDKRSEKTEATGQIAEASSSIRPSEQLLAFPPSLHRLFSTNNTETSGAATDVTRGKIDLSTLLGSPVEKIRGRWKNRVRDPRWSRTFNAIFHRCSETVAKRRETTGSISALFLSLFPRFILPLSFLLLLFPFCF